MRSEISHCRFQENSVSKLLNERNRVTLWDELTQHKAVTQKTSFWFSSDYISFVTVLGESETEYFGSHWSLWWQEISSLQIPRKQCEQTTQWKQQCNTVRWIQTSQSSFSEGFFLVFNWGYFLFHLRPQCIHKYPIADPS